MASGRLDGKIAIVTGGASGFGRAIATKFTREGCRVVIADRTEEAGRAVAAELDCLFVRTDVASQADWEQLLARTLEAHGRLDIVVNNAGACYTNKVSHDVTPDEFDLVFAVNVKGFYLSTRVLLPYFIAENRPGCFVQVTSTAGVRPRPRLGWYSASKGALVMATKAMAVEYAPQKIRFVAVAPTVGRTAMTHLFVGGDPGDEDRIAPFVASVPLGRATEPADVANASCFLASDEASFITGVNFEVDGGRCI